MPALPGLAATVVLIFIGTVSVAFYLLPVLIGWQRHVPDLGSVAAINLLLGWTLVGWAVALAMALRSARPGLGTSIQVINNPQQPAPPHPTATRPYPPPSPDLAVGRQPSDAPGLLPLPPPGPQAGHQPDQARRTGDAG